MNAKNWYKSKTLMFNGTMLVLYSVMVYFHPKPENIQLEVLIAGTTAITNIFLRLLTDRPIK